MKNQIYLNKYLFKLVTISPYAIKIISIKEPNSFSDQRSNFLNKHIPVQTQRKEIFNVFKLINEDTIAMLLTQL